MKLRRNGFTIVEIMVVVIILGLLAAFIVPGMFKKLGAAKTKIARSKMAIIESALEQFAINCGRLPTDEESLDALLIAPPELEETWVSLGIKTSHIIDPWDNPYIYVMEGTINTGSYDLISLGADGAEGGEGENADIFND
jgi:general secretion pathway protein G